MDSGLFYTVRAKLLCLPHGIGRVFRRGFQWSRRGPGQAFRRGFQWFPRGPGQAIRRGFQWFPRGLGGAIRRGFQWFPRHRPGRSWPTETQSEHEALLHCIVAAAVAAQDISF